MGVADGPSPAGRSSQSLSLVAGSRIEWSVAAGGLVLVLVLAVVLAHLLVLVLVLAPVLAHLLVLVLALRADPLHDGATRAGDGAHEPGERGDLGGVVCVAAVVVLLDLGGGLCRHVLEYLLHLLALARLAAHLL